MKGGNLKVTKWSQTRKKKTKLAQVGNSWYLLRGVTSFICICFHALWAMCLTLNLPLLPVERSGQSLDRWASTRDQIQETLIQKSLAISWLEGCHRPPAPCAEVIICDFFSSCSGNMSVLNDHLCGVLCLSAHQSLQSSVTVTVAAADDPPLKYIKTL